ncbi:putative LRR receptor-like serine/threonine-protein kinase [Cinnamomum micranthum f. kanehirae]|uniref:Putative LRR receptor-like serine/threonine-protein kinase n=1 Tax=Cinnamomum micranthum f. kanehirae TaxID=337451 RepID=A0A443PXL6_9MAGN|nr:putative LRR receptor-like serine/threonine-protein kinase [Cinnamomum micranthum f. kanehirae]
MVPTSYSTLSPIYNAMEIFLIGDALTNGTDSNDVHALAQLQEKYAQLQAWSGDPCLPSTFNWEWVGCSSDPSPRIISLDLSGLGLEGPFPDISALDALQIMISGNPYLCASGNSCGSSGSPPNYHFNSPSSGVNSPNSYFNSPNSVNTIGTTSSYSSKNLPVTYGTFISSFSIVWLIVGHSIHGTEVWKYAIKLKSIEGSICCGASIEPIIRSSSRIAKLNPIVGISLIIHPLTQTPYFKGRYEGQLIGLRLRHTDTNAGPFRNINHFIINQQIHQSCHRSPIIAVELKVKGRRRRSPIIVPIVEARPNKDRNPLVDINRVTVLLPNGEDSESAHHLRDRAGVLHQSAFAVLDQGIISFPDNVIAVCVEVFGATVYADENCMLDHEKKD